MGQAKIPPMRNSDFLMAQRNLEDENELLYP
jgi:hypothetical protein